MRLPTLFFLLLAFTLQAQDFPSPTPAKDRMESYQTRQNLRRQSILNEIPFRNVGPTVMSGRVADIDVGKRILPTSLLPTPRAASGKQRTMVCPSSRSSIRKQ